MDLSRGLGDVYKRQSLTSGANECAHLTYYHADSGEKITLN
jgi:hypothetical protein